MPKKALVTAGFVGKSLVAELSVQKYSIYALVRSEAAYLASGISKVIVPNLVAQTDFKSTLKIMGQPA